VVSGLSSDRLTQTGDHPALFGKGDYSWPPDKRSDLK
jgi:hypothetical protein